VAFTDFAQAKRDPRVRKRISERLFRDRVSREVVGTPTWARRKPNVRVAGDLEWEVDVPLAVAAAFVTT
jgi:hypothetical protein